MSYPKRPKSSTYYLATLCKIWATFLAQNIRSHWPELSALQLFVSVSECAMDDIHLFVRLKQASKHQFLLFEIFFQGFSKEIIKNQRNFRDFHKNSLKITGFSVNFIPILGKSYNFQGFSEEIIKNHKVLRDFHKNSLKIIEFIRDFHTNPWKIIQFSGIFRRNS